jgi:hypothetical protein
MIRLLIFVAFTALLSGPAFAQSLADKQACKADAQKFCPDVKPGGGRVLECLAPVKDQLSAPRAARCWRGTESSGVLSR